MSSRGRASPCPAAGEGSPLSQRPPEEPRPAGSGPPSYNSALPRPTRRYKKGGKKRPRPATAQARRPQPAGPPSAGRGATRGAGALRPGKNRRREERARLAHARACVHFPRPAPAGGAGARGGRLRAVVTCRRRAASRYGRARRVCDALGAARERGRGSGRSRRGAEQRDRRRPGNVENQLAHNHLPCSGALPGNAHPPSDRCVDDPLSCWIAHIKG